MIESKQNNKLKILPTLPLRGIPIFPYMVIHFDVGREISINAIEDAMMNGRELFIVAQRDASLESVQSEDLFNVGTVCTVKQVLRISENNIRILVEGKRRASVVECVSEEPFFKFSICEYEPKFVDDISYRFETEAYIKELKTFSAEYFSLVSHVPDEIDISFANEKNPEKFSDILAAAMILDLEEKQKLLDKTDVLERLRLLLEIMYHEINVLRIEREISSKVKKRIDENQRDYYLREQLKVIHEELGDNDNIDDEIEAYEDKFKTMNLPEQVEQKVKKELDRLSKMQLSSPEASVIRNYLDWIADIPWNIKSNENDDLSKASQILADSHYGLEKVKQRIMEFLSVRKLSKGKKSPVICLVGPPGVGKTSIAKAVAECLNRKYVRMSLGGVHDEAEIRGHRRTYIGSMPGRIVTAIKQAGTFNPLILLDEIDKVGADYRGNVSAALLEVLDTEQNFSFRDHYIEADIDLSDVLFITTANTLDTVDRPLLDRMEIIEITGYTDEEKLHISNDFIVPKQTELAGLKKANIKFGEGVILKIIHSYTRESGVRELERKIASVVRKVASEIATNGKKSVSVSTKNLNKFLGRELYDDISKNQEDSVGIATGLAWTQYGGDTLSIEVNTMDGNGEIELTGQLGDVMKESAKAAISYIRSHAEKLGIDSDFHSKKDLHIHIPEGAVPKDGPSAGITMATAIISSLTGKKISKDVAMTGEITITGRILPIGGLKEKSLAAYRAGIKTILIPKENEEDTLDLPEQIRKDINFVTADSMDKVLNTAFTN